MGARDRGSGVDRIQTTGRWEFVGGRRDGRYQGASIRSYRAGDSLRLLFYGKRLRIYGVGGPNGGRAKITFGAGAGSVFTLYAPRKKAHIALFDGVWATPGYRIAHVTVLGERSAERRYVNIDEFAIETGRDSK